MRETEDGDGGVVWELGDASDDDDGEEVSRRKSKDGKRPSLDGSTAPSHRGEEGRGLIHGDDAYDPWADRGDSRHRNSHSSDATIVRGVPSDGKGDDEFGEWQEGGRQGAK